mmetsp:Transcript_33822/g.54445  ORF Transcript_33822/g.54445 Transcript_33822/m.54445 type:complete len:326 (+) Transcript_33822:99-1076(+)
MGDEKSNDQAGNAAKERWEKWMEENKQPTCSNGYLFDCLGHDIHVTEVLPMTLFLISAIMFLLLVSNAADIKSVIFAGMAMGSSGVALIAFWNYADIIKPRVQADLLEGLVKDFGGQLDQHKENNDTLSEEVKKLQADTDDIKKESEKLGKQLGILNDAGNQIEGVLDGYEAFLKSKERLDEFRAKEIEVRESLLGLEADFLVSNTVNRIKRGMKDLYSNYVDIDEDTGMEKKYISFKKDADGKFENKLASEFLQRIDSELSDSPEVLDELKSKMDSIDADGDGKLTTWEFMLEVDKAVDKWADSEREKQLKKKMEEMSAEEKKS